MTYRSTIWVGPRRGKLVARNGADKRAWTAAKSTDTYPRGGGRWNSTLVLRWKYET